MVTPVAVAGPMFVATIVNTRSFPTTIGLGATLIVNAESTELLSMQHVGSRVETFNVHVPMLPEKFAVSSKTNNCHVPFGLVPLKTAKSIPYGPAGAGDNIVSPTWKSVGLKVPET